MTIQVTLTTRTYNPLLGQFITTYTVVTGTFRTAVATLSALPPGGNVLHDVRVTLDDNHLYCWNGTTWIDVGVSDVYDYVVDESIPGPSAGFTPNWNDISGKPSSTPNAIDSAVNNSHAPHSDDQNISGKEDVANKSTDNTLGGLTPSDTLYPSQQAVKEYVDALPAGGGLSVIQDNTDSLVAQESKIITHASDPLFKRFIEIISQLNIPYNLEYNPGTQLNYDYDPTKVLFTGSQVQLNNSFGAPGMVAYYLFDHNVADMLPTLLHPGTEHGSVSYTDGIIDWALSLNGVDAYVDIANHSDFYIVNPTINSIGIEFWLNTTATDGDIIGLWNETDNRRSWRLYLQGGVLKFDVSVDGITAISSQIGYGYNYGSWTHIGIYLDSYYSGAYYKVFVNGNQSSLPGFISSFSYPLFQNTIDPVRIGALGGATPSNFIYGSIAELAIYRNYDLTQPIGMASSVFQVHYTKNIQGQHLASYDTSIQNIKTNSLGRIDTSSWLGITGLNVQGDIWGSFEISFLFSVDSGTTWKMWNGSTWQTVTESTQGTLSSNLPQDKISWDSLFVAGTLDVILQIKTNDNTQTPTIYDVAIQSLMPGFMIVTNYFNINFLNATQIKIQNSTSEINGVQTFYNIKTNIVL